MYISCSALVLVLLPSMNDSTYHTIRSFHASRRLEPFRRAVSAKYAFSWMYDIWTWHRRIHIDLCCYHLLIRIMVIRWRYPIAVLPDYRQNTRAILDRRDLEGIRHS
ncbi:hypothetical protein GGR58DRAFT_461844 [Xylaria digitata]|nr:hypothetical protein GGR58DRAFT_461844 [Xylaria digitata]